MKPEPLAGCYEQTEWAKTAINKLQADIREFFSTYPYEIVSDVDVEAGEEVHRFKLKSELPRQLRIDVGHILASLRDPRHNVLANPPPQEG